jgi:hypothetical protein
MSVATAMWDTHPCGSCLGHEREHERGGPRRLVPTDGHKATSGLGATSQIAPEMPREAWQPGAGVYGPRRPREITGSSR